LAFQARTKALTLLETIVEALNRTSYKEWTIESVKNARCTGDPAWLFCFKKSLSTRQKNRIRRAIKKFLAVANSYIYEDEHGNDIDPIWFYEHPRADCDHSALDTGCDMDMVVSPEDANELMDWVQDGTISIEWVRSEEGPVAEDESMDTY
jgi:hypothetical protein